MLLDEVLDCFVSRFNRTICLGMGYTGGTLLYPILFTKFQKLPTIKLGSVIRDYFCWRAESSNDVAPDKAYHLRGGDGCKGFDFNPFGEVINGDHRELKSSLCQRELADDVNASYRAWSWRRHLGEAVSRKSLTTGEPLTNIAALGILDGIRDERRPIVS